jgi:hypothetical protein
MDPTIDLKLEKYLNLVAKGKEDLDLEKNLNFLTIDGLSMIGVPPLKHKDSLPRLSNSPFSSLFL